MDNALYKKYLTIEKKLKEIGEEREELRTIILANMRKDGLEKAETEYGTFSSTVHVRYNYSDKVIVLEDKVKIAKKKEQEKGIAEKVETPSLRYSAPKAL